MTDAAKNNENNMNDVTEQNASETTGAVNQDQESSNEQAQQQTNESTDPIAALEKERDDMRDKMMRALAEAENTRKRAERAQIDTSKYAIAGFAKDMLDIADNLRRALVAISEDQREQMKSLLDGVEATERVMLTAFEKHGIKKIEPTSGKFDPNYHEVMFEAEIDGKPAGEIIQLLEAGYVLHDRLLRPARVGVAKAAHKGQPSEHQLDQEV